MTHTTATPWHRWKWGIALAAAGAIGLYLLRPTVLVSLARWLDVGETPRAVDYVMVLPGAAERRPFVAVAMLHAGLAQGVLTARTETDPANDAGIVPPADETFQKIMLSRGIRPDQIHILPGHSHSTWTDALALAEFLKTSPDATVAIVTDCFHTRRSRWGFQSVLGTQARRVYFVSAKLDGITPENWWTTEEGLGTYLIEYCKLVAYVAGDHRLLGGTAGLCLSIALIRILRRRRHDAKMA